MSLKILKLAAENFKKLKAIEITPAGNMVEITGKCEQGKTSILDVIKATLCGEKFEEPIRQGEKSGKSVVDLGDKIITRTFTESGGTLKVESRDGAKYPSPQALLDKMIGKIAFDPLSFAKEKDPKKQVEMLLKVVNVSVDPVKLQEISGVKVEIMPNPLDMLNTAYKAVYDERTAVSRQADAAKKTLESLPKVEEVKAVSLAELVAEKEKLQAVNREHQEKRDALVVQKQSMVSIEQKHDRICDEIKYLENQLILKQSELVATVDEMFAAQSDYEKVSGEVLSLQDEDLTEINDKISKADETNKQAQQYITYQAKFTESEKHQAEADALTAKIEAIKKYKMDIIANTKMPVPGLDFAGGGVTFEGKPFSQASTAQKIRVGVAIGMAGNPELRVIMIDGYESLDSDQRKIVEELAIENDFQVWTTAVSDAGVGIYIEDGEIKTAEVAE